MATPNTNITGFNALFATNTGALVVQMPDGTTANGNARGAFAVDLQSTRTAATQVASGANSFTAGKNNTASAVGGVAIGEQNTAGGTNGFAAGFGCSANATRAVALGNSCTVIANHAFAVGDSCTADANASVAMGASAIARGITGTWQYSGSTRSAAGDRQLRKIPQSSVTTNATPTVLTTTGAAELTTNTWVIPNNFGGIFTGWILARNTANNDQIAWRFEGMVTRDASAATVVLLGTVTPTAVGTADTGMTTATLAVGVNTTNGSLIVTATGIAATTIHWTGWIDCSENG